VAKVLVVDDDPGLRQSLGLLLEAEGYDLSAEGSPSRALALAAREPFDLILCDVKMPEMDGLQFLRRYRDEGGQALVIMMSAYGGEDAAIAAMKEGAYDYLPKPFRSDEVLLTLQKALEREQLRGRVIALEAELSRWTDLDIVAESAAMRQVMDLATRVAAHATTVLVTGESGTGKEVVARAIHRMSPRREGAFVAVNCGAIPAELLESELFGHVKGAFTGATADKAGLFEEAHRGTLLLDEVGDLPPALQVKLLRVLQESEVRRVGESRTRAVDVRVLAATARDLEADVKAGRFREDLFYRLNVVRIHIPPLRERPEDIPGLVSALLARAVKRSGRDVHITPAAIAILSAQPWPGNVRELENALERAVVLSADGAIGPDSVGQTVSGGVGGPERLNVGPSDRLVETSGRPVGPVSLNEAVAAAEREAIQRALQAAQGNRREAAKVLGISVRTLFYKLKQLGL
jgi:two-component system response regulator AtoC